MCDSDYNAYTEDVNPKPEGGKTNIRSAGFHIHIGYANNNIDTSLKLVKYLDFYLGVPSVLKDKDKKRRSLYGKAGCFRLTNYGVEYRVLSSTLMKNVASLEFVWNQLSKAIIAHNRDCGLPDSSLVIEAINNSDTELAKKLITTYDLID